MYFHYQQGEKMASHFLCPSETLLCCYIMATLLFEGVYISYTACDHISFYGNYENTHKVGKSDGP